MIIDTINTARKDYGKKEPVPNDDSQGLLSLSKPEKTNSLSSPYFNAYSAKTSPKKGVSAAERNNNPLNIKYGNFARGYGATKEAKPALDGGSFATFPTVDAGLKAGRDLLTGKNYRNLTVDQALRRWSNNGYGGEIVPELAGTAVKDLSGEQLAKLQRKQIMREDRNYAKKLGYFKYGGQIRKLAYGDDLTNGVGYKSPMSYPGAGLDAYSVNGATNTLMPSTPGMGAGINRFNNGGGDPNPRGGGMNAGMLSTGLGLAGSALSTLDNNPKKVNKPVNIGSGVLKGAAAGATVGSIIPGWGTAVGAIVGGAVGGITAGIKGNKKQKAIDAAIKQDQVNFRQGVEDRSAYMYRQLNPYQYKYGGDLKPTPRNPSLNIHGKPLATGKAIPSYPEANFIAPAGYAPINMAVRSLMRAGNIAQGLKNITQKPLYNNGGNIFTPEYEAEKGEVIQGDPILEAGKRLSSNLHLVKGKTHEKGGTLGSGGERVFSNSISFNGETPAKTALSIGNKLKKFEPMLTSKDAMKKRTALLMTDKLTTKLDNVFNMQEEFKAASLPGFRYGGYLPKFATGGKIEEDDLDKLLKDLENNVTQKKLEAKRLRDSANAKELSQAERAKILRVVELRDREIADIDKQRSDISKKVKYTSEQFKRSGSSIKNTVLGLPNTKEVSKTISEARTQIAKLNTRSKQIDSLTPDKFNTYKIGSSTNQNYGITPKSNSGVISKGISKALPATIDFNSSAPIKKTLEKPLSIEERRAGRRARETASPIGEPVVNTNQPPVKNNRTGLSSTPASTPSTITKKPWSISPEVDKAIRGDNRIGNLRGGTTMGQVDPIARIGTNTIQDPGKVRTRPLSKIDPLLATGVGLAGIGYLNNASLINKMQTDVPVSLTPSPYYGYRDRSRASREGLSAVMNNVNSNANISPAEKQAMFARYSQGLNDINIQENSNRFGYDADFNNQVFRTNISNNAIVNQATQQRIANENAKLANRGDNFNNFMGNINTIIAEQQERKLNEKRFGILSDSYRKQYNTNFGITQ